MPCNEKQTLCWNCANACGGCAWSDHWRHEPIPGWKAEKHQLRINNGLYDVSYTVHECPEFKPEIKKR